MGIYLFVFAFSAINLYLSRRIKYRFAKKILVSISILVPSVLAGLRSSTIGVDVAVYGIPSFERAKNCSSIVGFLSQQILIGNKDLGFNALVYIVSRFATDYHWSLFAYTFITISVMYAALNRYEKIYNTPVWLTMLLYYLCLYNASLNILRQTIAVSFVALASTYLLEKKYKNYIFWIIIAFLFHSSAILGIIFLPMYLLLQGQNSNISETKQIRRGLIFIFLIAFIVVGASRLIQLLVNMGIFRENYLRYLSGGSYSTATEEASISIVALAIQLVYMGILCLHYKLMKRKELPSLYFFMGSGLVLLFSCFAPIFASYVSRLSFYFILLQIVGLASTVRVYKKNSRIIWTSVILSFILYTWIRTYVILGYHATVPYKFFWK